MKGIVKEIIRRCGDTRSHPTFNPHIFPDISFLRMDCVLDCLLRMSKREFGNIQESKHIITALRLLKDELKPFIDIKESDKNLIALREQLKAKYLDSPDQFNFYLRKNIDACKGCWDINEGQQKTVKTYLATVLLIYASDVLCKRKKRIDFNSKRIIKTSLTLPIS